MGKDMTGADMPMDIAHGPFHFNGSTLAYAGLHLHEEGHPVHSHSFVEIAFTVGGLGAHVSLAGRHELTPGDVVLLRPGIWHAYEDCQRLVLYNCCFSSELLHKELAWTREDPLLGYLLWNGPYAAPRRGVLGFRLDEAARTARPEQLRAPLQGPLRAQRDHLPQALRRPGRPRPRREGVMTAWPVFLASADGLRLDQPSYERDFGDNLWAVDGADCWKLERMQEYAEVGFPSWEALMAGDWSLSLRLYAEERPAIAAFQEKLRRHGSRFYRVRVVAEPVTPYLQWELHCLRLRASCGEDIRVVHASAISAFEPSGPLPELVSLRGRVLYQTLYNDRAEPDGAVRFADTDVVSTYEAFARGLYEAGEDVESYFARKIAHLPPPSPDARPGQ
jgi:hypothetical protein